MPPGFLKTLWTVALAAVVLQCIACFGTEAKRGEAKADEPLIFRAYKIPPRFFALPKDSSKPEGSSPAPGPKWTADESKNAKIYLEDQGIKFPAGSEIFCDSTGGFLAVRQTKENLDHMDVIFYAEECGIPSQLEIEISAYQFPANKFPDAQHLTFDLLKGLGKKLVLLDKVTCVTKSGQRSVSNSLQATPSTSPNPQQKQAESTKPDPASSGQDISFLPGEYGTKVEVEPVIGADGQTIDINLIYRLHIPIADNSKPTTLDVFVKSSIVTSDWCPGVIKSATVPCVSKSGSPAELQSVVIVLQPRLLTTQGKPCWDGAKTFPVSSSKDK